MKDFLEDRKTIGKADSIIRYYKQELNQFQEWLLQNNLDNQPIIEFTPSQFREYFVYISQPRTSSYNKTGKTNGRGKSVRHASFRYLRALFNWVWEQEDYEFRNPISKVKVEPSHRPRLEEMPTENIQKMINH